MAFKVFFSYARKDELLLDKLKEHLAPLKTLCQQEDTSEKFIRLTEYLPDLRLHSSKFLSFEPAHPFL